MFSYISLYFLYLWFSIQGRGVSIEEDSEDSSPRTKVITTKYGEVQGRIFSLTRANEKKEESNSNKGSDSKTKPNKYSREKNSHGYDNADFSSTLPPVAIYYGIPYATPPVGINR